MITITSIVNANNYIYLDQFDHRLMKAVAAHQYEGIGVHKLDEYSSSKMVILLEGKLFGRKNLRTLGYSSCDSTEPTLPLQTPLDC